MTVNNRDVQHVVVYGASWCGPCHRLRSQLERAGVVFEAIDVDDHPEVLALLSSVNDGAWLIPTVVVGGRTVLVNPSAVAVQEAMG